MLNRTCAATTFLLGTAGIARWVVGFPAYIAIPSWPTMSSPNTSVMLMVVGAALWLLSTRTAAETRLASRRWSRNWAVALGSAVVVCAVWRIAEIELGRDLFFELLFRKIPRMAEFTPSPGTMSFPTATCLGLAGVAIILLARWQLRSRTRLVAGWLGVSCLAIGVLFMLGHISGTPLTYGGRPLAMAPNTALGLIAGGFGIAVIVARHERQSSVRVIESLRAVRQSLDRRVDQRTEELRQALEALRRETDERRKSEASLVHAQKMESIGQLAAGIAHDFNNLLMVIATGARTGMRAAPPQVAASLEQIQDAAKRGSAMTARLLAFARRGLTPDLHTVETRPLVNDIVTLVKPMLGHAIDARIVTDPGIWPVNADPGQIEQVLVNLCINAKDAMPQGGTLTLHASNAAVQRPLAAVPEVVPPGDYVILEIKDTGTGMTREVLARAFEPFFTTKAERGTGLGLATSYGIVRQHGGRITVDSQPGVGTNFRIFLPRAHLGPGAE